MIESEAEIDLIIRGLSPRATSTMRVRYRYLGRGCPGLTIVRDQLGDEMSQAQLDTERHYQEQIDEDRNAYALARGDDD